MPADYRILPDKGLAYINFRGHLTMAEVQSCAQNLGSNPLNQNLYKHLVDFSEVISYSPDVVEIIEMQARIADLIKDDPAQWIFVYLAPTPISKRLASYGIRAWTDAQNVVIRLVDSEIHAMDILGLSERSINDALQGATPTTG